jgi:hypothetical protein
VYVFREDSWLRSTGRTTDCKGAFSPSSYKVYAETLRSSNDSTFAQVWESQIETWCFTLNSIVASVNNLLLLLDFEWSIEFHLQSSILALDTIQNCRSPDSRHCVEAKPSFTVFWNIVQYFDRTKISNWAVRNSETADRVLKNEISRIVKILSTFKMVHSKGLTFVSAISVPPQKMYYSGR